MALRARSSAVARRLVASLFALVALMLGARAADAAEKRIAVLEFRAKGIETSALAHLSDEVRGGVLDAIRERGRMADFLVMTRESMAVILRDMKIGSCQEGECEVETARNIGAQYVVSGEVVQIEGTRLVSLKLHETEKGALLAQERTEGKSVLDLVRELPATSRKLMEPLVPAPPPAPEPIAASAGSQRTTATGTAAPQSSPPPPPTTSPERSDEVVQAGPSVGEAIGVAVREAGRAISSGLRWAFHPHAGPPADRDGDGVEDMVDRCPEQPGPPENQGCPMGAVAVPDTDRDGIADDRDACPEQAGPAELNGCPRAYQWVSVSAEQIEPREPISLDPRGPSTTASRAVLDEVAQVLRDYPSIRRVRIEAHVDADGRPEGQLVAVTQSRAESVRSYLIAAGVAPSRLQAVGYGASRPIAPNDTLENRETNRRIAFSIIERR